ncbi:glutamate N-acetyltransferase [Antricoccus suffuscus]|uniref:Arginine biosynthesis bifunctional protein ArgJ n=1 Tax=Antricoccus suffuscus TaxID=1629062 RepID=A0A2T0ZWH7_9ACTN|nr:bifunctional glutamate N-acetyltransferase/amino-acid acetyltransferase ArgJ [Antricoccus suffuscus]PRZ40683.1 glutamate N-acetyltransferase [Antricoccus suffuscus]
MSVTKPKGFRASGVTAGFKDSGKSDLALVVNDGPSHAAACVFTSNRCKANPVLWSEEVIKDGEVAAIILNSGGANCYTGAPGFQLTHATAEALATELSISSGDVLVCSTGLIGPLFSADKMLAAVPNVVAALSTDGADAAATAIMTTDTVSKQATYDGPGWSIGAMAKGAGMLAPALATMLIVITTDVDLAPAQLDEALRVACATSFNRLDSDGCQSTNDTVALLASGAAQISPDLAEFTDALSSVCVDIALQLMQDAEGASHDLYITTTHAASEADALEVSRSVARSNLFKCAVFGNDPNWGRVLAAAGTTTAAFEPHQLDVAINGIWVCKDGQGAADPESVDMTPRKCEILIDLKAGDAEVTVWSNDLTHDYVHENSAYST